MISNPADSVEQNAVAEVPKSTLQMRARAPKPSAIPLTPNSSPSPGVAWLLRGELPVSLNVELPGAVLRVRGIAPPAPAVCATIDPWSSDPTRCAAAARPLTRFSIQKSAAEAQSETALPTPVQTGCRLRLAAERGCAIATRCAAGTRPP